LAVSLAVFFPAAALAQTTDPSTLQIGNPPAAGDPNLIGNSGLVVINQNSGGGPSANLNPVLLIIGIANDSSTNFFKSGSPNPISSVTYSSGGTASWQLGGKDPYPDGSWNATTGFGGIMNGGKNHNEAYSIIGLNGANSSNNFGNWSGADLTANGINVSSFNLYVFQLSDPNGLSDKGSISVQFAAGALPVGSFAIAFSETASGPSPYATPFTEAGLETNGSVSSVTPEPSSFVLAAIGVLGGLAFARYYRRGRSPVLTSA
jgi:hypothetical protein